jgi:type II secretory pathway predicted ATPase ExeA
MINSRILNMTILATITCNSNILDVLKSKMNRHKQQLNMYSQNMMNRQIVVHHTYHSFAGKVTAVTLLMITLEKIGRSSRR